MNKLLGLILIGGQSRRMGADKSLLDYHGVSQRAHLLAMLAPLCDRVVFSCRSDQLPGRTPDGVYQPDLAGYEDCGPLSGIYAAFTAYPEHALLVTGCDYPLLTEADLKLLADNRSAEYDAVVFVGEAGGAVFEPLPVLLEVSASVALSVCMARGEYSVMRFIGGLRYRSVSLPDPVHLRNANDPEARQAMSRMISGTPD